MATKAALALVATLLLASASGRVIPASDVGVFGRTFLTTCDDGRACAQVPRAAHGRAAPRAFRSLTDAPWQSCWPGTVWFTGVTNTASITALFGSDDANYYDVSLNGEIVANFTNTTRFSLPLVPRANNNVAFMRRTECSIGLSSFFGLEVDDQAMILPSASTRGIEFIGDSLTCGYGDLGMWPCHFSAVTESASFTAGALVAKKLQLPYNIEVGGWLARVIATLGVTRWRAGHERLRRGAELRRPEHDVAGPAPVLLPAHACQQCLSALE
jgi:hypothetical protein